MYLCYLDESGTPEIPGTSSHFVLAALAIPIEKWKSYDDEIAAIKARHELSGREIHTAFLLRPYKEQEEIEGFEKLDSASRRDQVKALRGSKIRQLTGKVELERLRSIKKTFKKTDPYVHLTLEQRKRFVADVAYCVAKWKDARLFGESIAKDFFSRVSHIRRVDEQALEQVVTRFHHFLTRNGNKFGLLIHDNNQTVAQRHTELMRNFHKAGTLWTSINRIVETPFFVDSELTSMIQIADLCSYAIRRYSENKEESLFQIIHPLTDQVGGRFVGLRHYVGKKRSKCSCLICQFHQ